MRNATQERPIFPVCLLIQGKPCLVVGGGAIAARKAGHLLDAAADVTVVSPDACPPLQALAGDGRIRWAARAFHRDDVKGKYLVMAATDDAGVNRAVIDACREEGILCSAADRNWPDGDFIMPAITRQGGVVATVATGGRSCRQARIVKDRIAALLAALTAEAPGTDADDN